MNFFSKLLIRAKHKKLKKNPVIVCAEEEEILKAVMDAFVEKVIESPILIGDSIKIIEILKKLTIDYSTIEIINSITKEEASSLAIDLIINKKADFLVKGLVDTSIILKAILNKKEMFSQNKEIFFSHVAVAQLDNLNKIIIFGDSAMNILPNVNQKINILENCYLVAEKLKIKKPKIAIIAAKEKVSEKMIATLDADIITKKFSDDKRFIVEGPLALDNALSEKASEIKGITGKIKGDADILIMPNIETGNVFYKSLCYLTEAKIAGILVGASIPIVLTSRADSEESKFLSIVLASIM
ncbi:phosphate acyltransferase [Cetobacterium sp. SF1]|uniref:phosphate acyltransferase n=1 Tax=unclassified Cetobacterium TaxID=2630983 RepID=UPI003CF4D32A